MFFLANLLGMEFKLHNKCAVSVSIPISLNFHSGYQNFIVWLGMVFQFIISSLLNSLSALYSTPPFTSHNELIGHWLGQFLLSLKFVLPKTRKEHEA